MIEIPYFLCKLTWIWSITVIDEPLDSDSLKCLCFFILVLLLFFFSIDQRNFWVNHKTRSMNFCEMINIKPINMGIMCFSAGSFNECLIESMEHWSPKQNDDCLLMFFSPLFLFLSFRWICNLNIFHSYRILLYRFYVNTHWGQWMSNWRELKCSHVMIMFLEEFNSRDI